MYTKNIFAAGALMSVVAAVPMVKRDVVWVTETDEAVVTVPVTTTVWVNPGEAVPTTEASLSSVSHYGHHHHFSSDDSSAPASTAAAPSSPSSQAAPSSSSVYVAPSSSSVYVAPSSSSVYVAPSSSSVYVAPSSSSVYVAPTTSAYVAPTTSTTSAYVAPTTSSTPTTTQANSAGSGSAPAAATCTNSNSGQTLSGAGAVGTSYSGDLTWYQTGMGACGCNSGSSDYIVAIAESLFDQYTPSSGNPNLNPLCGKQVSITGVDGTAYTASIVDRCTGCKEADLDLSENFFNTVTNNGDGRVHNMKWSFLN